MKKQLLIDYFGGTSATALALDVKQPSVSQWPDDLPYAVLGRIAILQPVAWSVLNSADDSSDSRKDH